MAGLAFKMFGTWFGWANLVSLLFMCSGLIPLYKLAQRFVDADSSWWTLLFFLTQPLIIIYAGVASPEGMSLVAAIWFMFFATKLWDEPKAGWAALAAVFGGWAELAVVLTHRNQGF